MLRRFLIGVLCFVLGFATCIASIVGVGWVAYSKISLRSLEKSGLIEVDENALRGEGAEVDITKLTLEGLVAEVSKLSRLEEAVSLDLLIERYRLKLPEQTLKLIPEGVRGLPLTEILSERGIEKILESTEVEYLYTFLPSDLLSDPAKEALADKTLAEVAELDLGHLLSDVKLGYLTGVKYEKNAKTGEYEPVYGNPEQPSLNEMLSEINAAELLDLFANGGDIAELFGKYMNDVLVSHFLGAFMDLSDMPLGGMLEGKTFGEVLVFDEKTGVYSLSLGTLIGGTFAELLDLTPIYHDAETEDFIIGWRDAKGEPVYGVMRGIAEKSVETLLSENFDVMALLSDVYLGDVMSYRPTFDGEGNLLTWKDAEGNAASGIMAPLVELKLGEITGGSFDFVSVLDGVYVGDLLSYTPVKGDPLDPDRITGWTKDGTPLTGVELATASIDLGRLLSDDTYKIGSAFDSLLLGELLGYEKRDGVWYEAGKNERASELYAKVAELSVGALISGEADFESVLSDLYLGEMLGYEKGERISGDGEEERYKWYKIEKNPDGTTTRIGEVDGIEARIASYKLGALINGTAEINAEELITGMTIGEIMGYTPHYQTDGDGEPTDEIDYWCDGNGIRVTGLMAAIAGEEIAAFEDGTLMSRVALGDVLGYYYDSENGVWLVSAPSDGQPTPARVGGIMGVLADKKVDQLSTAVDGVFIGEIMGYVEKNGTWYEVYDGTDPSRNVKASGVMAAFAGLTVGRMSDADAVTAAMNKVKLGDAMGYYYDTANGVWLESEGGERVGGITASFVDLTVGEMSDPNTVTEAMNTVTLGDAMGYYYVSTNGVGLVSAPIDGQPTPAKVDGIMGVLAGKKINQLSTAIDGVYIGEIMGYVEKSGTWYEVYDGTDPSRNVKASGVMAVFAGLTVGEMSDPSAVTGAINSVTLGEALGYCYKESNQTWYESSAADAKPVSGVMGALAGTKIGGLSAKLESARIGELLGYEDGGRNSAGAVIWKDGGSDVAPIINKICNCGLGDLSSTLNSLVLGDIFTKSELESGFFRLLGADPASIELKDVPTEATEAVKMATIGALMDAELLEIDAYSDSLSALCMSRGKDRDYWKTLTFQRFIAFVVAPEEDRPT